MSEPMTAERLARLNSVANAEPKINGTTSLPMVITDEGADPWLLVPVEFLKEAMSEVSRLAAERDDDDRSAKAALAKLSNLLSDARNANYTLAKKIAYLEEDLAGERRIREAEGKMLAAENERLREEAKFAAGQLDCIMALEGDVATLLREKAVAAATIERLRDVVSLVQRLQPGGSPPPGDERVLVAWIVQSVQERSSVIARMLEKAVCTEGEDAGVILLDSQGTTHPEVVEGQLVEVYDNEFFSPLGEVLVGAWAAARELESN